MQKIMGLLCKVVVGIATEAISAFIRQRKSKVFCKALPAVRRQQNFQVNQLYLEEAMTFYGICSADSIKEIVDAINHLCKM